ncbi:MAG TPA: cytochrome b/b6 domain-containing protein [Coleofasciculaceae cyanobacterium]
MANSASPAPLAPPKPRRPNSSFQNLMSLHWWMAIAYLVLFVGGALMARLPDDVSVRPDLYEFHKSIGVLTIGLLLARILLLLRVWWRKYSRRLPKQSPRWWRLVFLHTLLYGLMIAVPTSGVFLSNSYKAANVKLFGILLPDFFPQDQAVLGLGRSLHFWLAYSFLMFVLVHSFEQRKVVRALWRRATGVFKSKSSAA